MPCVTARNLLLEDGGSHDYVDIASVRIMNCGDIAPTTLIATLRNATPDSQRDSAAQYAAWALSDRRLFDSVIVLSRCAQVTAARRQVALDLLVHYADSLASLAPGGLSDPIGLVISHRIHGFYIPSSDPLDAGDQDRALAAIWRLAREEPDGRLRRLAKLAAEQLELRRGFFREPR
jgi:hypothetical protein